MSASTSGRSCPHCGEKLIQASEGRAVVRIRGRLEFGADGLARSQCFWCEEPVTLPELKLSPAGPRLTVPADGR